MKLTSVVLVLMTTSKFKNQGDLTAYERWELPLVKGRNISSVSTAKELETIQSQAYQEGFTLGQKEGYAQAENEVETSSQSLLSILQLMTEPLNNFDDDIVEQLGHLSMLVAKQIIRRELHTDESEVVGIVREVMKSLPASSRQVVLQLNPDDAEIVRNAFSMGKESESEENSWKIVEDPLLMRGGCKVTSENSRIDATVESQLNHVITTLFGGERETDD